MGHPRGGCLCRSLRALGARLTTGGNMSMSRRLHRNPWHRLTLLAALLVSAALSLASADVAESDLRRDIRYLASDELGGRMSGQSGQWQAAEYIAERFRELDLTAVAADGYYQRFEFPSGKEMGGGTELTWGGVSWRHERDVLPLAYGAAGEAKGLVVFAGYGIASSRADHNSYASLDVEGKIVLVLSGAPEPSDDPGDYARAISARAKLAAASVRGATGLIYVRTTEDAARDQPLPFFGSVRSSGRIPGVSLSRAEALRILGGDWEPVMREDQEAIGERLGAELGQGSLKADLVNVSTETANVAGLLTGTDPDLMWEYIVVGAHYDHVGVDESGRVFNGADDNASGTTGVLALAEEFAARRGPTRRSILFIAFSGEELGLLGSRHYASAPLVPLQRTRAMLNMDMIGRLRNNNLMVFSAESGEGLAGLVEAAAASNGLEITFGGRAPGGSDHVPFMSAEIPCLFFFTGMHQQYHQPQDDWNLINYSGHAKVIDTAADVVEHLANTDSPPRWVGEEDEGGKRGFLGVMAATDSPSQRGFPIGRVVDGSGAEKAGLRAGDLIHEIDGKVIETPASLTPVLGEYAPGDVAELTVERDGRRMKVKVTLGSMP
ncbi:MAG: M28 family peptidase [Armatimonadia bacterium]|nr:M28 family peptidase [Armatimonadia bacterium]